MLNALIFVNYYYSYFCFVLSCKADLHPQNTDMNRKQWQTGSCMLWKGQKKYCKAHLSCEEAKIQKPKYGPQHLLQS